MTVDGILTAISDGIDTVEVVKRLCSLHGDHHHIVIYNQGGYDCTFCCLACAAELNALLK